MNGLPAVIRPRGPVELGLGAAWAAQADLLRCAVDLGYDWIDTAPAYGLGASERAVGDALAGRPEYGGVVSTKVGRLLVGKGERFDFSRDGVLRSFEESLVRLGRAPDYLLVHDPDQHLEEAVTSAIPALVELRDQGVITGIGAGMNDAGALSLLLNRADLDLILVAGRWTLLDQSATSLLREAATRAVPVVVGGVFNSGLLVDPQPGETFDYLPADQGRLDQALAWQALALDYGLPLPAVALAFAASHRAVSRILVGPRSVEELRHDTHLASLPVPEELWSAACSRGLLPADLIDSIDV